MAVLNKILCLGFMPFLLGAMNNMTHVGFDPNRWEYLQALPYKPSSGYTGNVYNKKYSFYDGELIVCKRVNTIEQLGWGEVKRAPWHNYIAGNETYQLKPDNHGNTMSCMYKNGRNPDYITSTLLLWSPAHQSNARFRTNTDSYLYVNGFDKRRLNVKNRQTYEYNFNVGEILNISCINMPGTPGQAKWIIEHNKLETWDKDDSNKWIKIRLDELHYNAYIKCLYEIESYEKDVDPIPAGQITVYFKLCTPTTQGCALPPPMSSLPPLPHTMSPDVTTPTTVNPFSVSNIASAKPVIFTEGPVEASDDNSKLKCQDYLFLTGLPPTVDTPNMSDDGDSIKCTSVLNYTQTPYHLDMVCYFQVAPDPDQKKRKRASIGFSELKLTMKGQNTSVSVISGPDASVKGNYIITNKDDGKKITCSLMRHEQEASSIDILLKYVPPPPTTTTTTPPSPTTLSPPTSKSISIEDNDGNKDEEASAETLNQDSGSGSVNMNNVWYGIGALAVIVLAVIVLVVGRRTCKQAKLEQKREQNEFDYENLQNDTPERQFPPNLENAYSLPYDSLGRPRAATDNISEISPYAVANYQGTAPSETYSIPHVEKDLSKLYSKPVPKSLRKELMYSKVLPKNMRKQDTPVKPQEISYAELETTISGRNQFKPVETTYSEVVTGYTNVNDKVNDYKNVVPPNSRYCNANDTEYAEPAYCELAKDTKKMVDRKK